jgi:hypothetical protein
MTQKTVIRAVKFVGTLLAIAAVMLIIATIINRVAPGSVRIGPTPQQLLIAAFGFRIVSGVIYTAWNRYRERRSSGLYTPEMRQSRTRLSSDEASTRSDEEYDYMPRKRKLSEEE